MIQLRNLGKDIRFLLRASKILKTTRPLSEATHFNVADYVEKTIDAFPDRPALMDHRGERTYSQFEARANQIAHWARDQEIGPGTVVALMMQNRPEYVEIWFGLQKLGATVSLINCNLIGAPLAHCINVSDCALVILDAELEEALASTSGLLEGDPPVWTTGDSLTGLPNMDEAADAMPETRFDPQIRSSIKRDDPAFYIYTSGTTGNPKAAVISHYRWLGAAFGFAGIGQAKPEHRFYIVLPLYHSTGGMAALGAVFMTGGCAFIKRKFSASEFWSDCKNYKLDRFQYIGELCRYLVNSPEHPDERSHGVSLALGNGLRPEVWPEFQQRFDIPNILEFYGATEGNISLFNLDGKVGAIGRVPKMLAKQFKMHIVKFDVENEIPIRDENGFCVDCAIDEPGEAIGFINPDDRATQVDGYTDKAASEKKILRDVFEKGDQYFRTGDLLRRDRDNYFYFVDRIGDTFRWKGENVSTAEVAEVVSTCDGIKEANVYGVQVGSMDGRAGMASLVTTEGFNADDLLTHVEANLPQYARPVFLRLQGEMEVTGTFKHRKVDLVREGFDPSSVQDPLFFLHPQEGRYVPMDTALYADIVSGKHRF